MRRIGLLCVALLALVAVGCACSVEKATVERLEATMNRQHKLFLGYVEADPKLTETQKQVERDNVQSQKDLVGSLKRATGD